VEEGRAVCGGRAEGWPGGGGAAAYNGGEGVEHGGAGWVGGVKAGGGEGGTGVWAISQQG